MDEPDLTLANYNFELPVFDDILLEYRPLEVELLPLDFELAVLEPLNLDPVLFAFEPLEYDWQPIDTDYQ